MLSRQSLIALSLAIVLALAAVFGANTFLDRSQQKAYEGATTKVAVASAPLAFGTDITPDKIRFVDYPNTSIPPGAFTNAAQLLPDGKKRVALMAIAVNEPILPNKISAAGQGASIAALLPDGMRATTVRINDVSGVAGFIQPNDSVDVLITRQVTAAGGNQQVTDVLLQNVHVLAIGQTAKDANGEPILARTATFAVTPIDAQKLALGQQVGDLSLVLRKPGEQNNPVVETVSMNDLRYNMYGGARYPAPAVVGTFGSGLGGAIAGSMEHSASVIANARRPARRVAAPAKAKNSVPADAGKQIQVYRGTKSDQVNVGG
jgi:pilus assembly protein CpaB